VFAPQPTAGVAIHVVTDQNHPCVGQKGLYAAAALVKGQPVIRYVGVVKRRVAGETGNDYLFGMAGLEVDIDAQLAGNESRYVNDFRGVGDAKNVQLAERQAVGGEMEVWFEALRDIAAGEELLTSYGDNFGLS
jgi:SET domain-containing protein